MQKFGKKFKDFKLKKSCTVRQQALTQYKFLQRLANNSVFNFKVESSCQIYSVGQSNNKAEQHEFVSEHVYEVWLACISNDCQ